MPTRAPTLTNITGAKPVLVHQRNDYTQKVFTQRPLLGALLFDNVDSDARDHCMAERTFLSWLRLSTYMSIVAVAILISFHLKNEPTKLEKRVALPFGIVFWGLSMMCLLAGLNNYIKTVIKYSRRRALAQSGSGTQVVAVVIATSIIAACILFLATNAGAK
ncbi:hypothetical protein M433DRAFT_140975 [Acidomyces richmondensis BFW]|nr:hypothetical protein M433DRAFT_140975 [Acidomyces richmondensis BFW]